MKLTLDRMEFKLTCVCCGSSEFEVKELPLTEIEGATYLYHEDINQKVVCKKCGLEDYIENLVLKVVLKEDLIEEM